MKTTLRILVPGLALLCTTTATTAAFAQPTKAPALAGPAMSVNPLVGTAEHGHTYPGATVPFGMVQLSPDTPLQGWDGSSGYHYSDSVIRGFSHSHLSGTGVGGLGDILLMPTVGNVSLNNYGYASKFSHAQETANPGYYKVSLLDTGITAELTATARAGFHKYTFPASTNSHIVLNLQHGVGNSVIESSMKVENNTTISGTRISNGWGGRRAVYFVMEFSKPFAGYTIQQNGAQFAGTEASGTDLKSYVNFTTTAGEAIYVKVGISGTSVEGARKNLNAEVPGWDFNATHAKAMGQWNDLLGQVQIDTPDVKTRRTFYTALYQSCIAPVLFNDVDGTYRGGDKQNHVGTFQNYTTFSLWDTFRAQQPLLTLFQPNRISDMVNAMVALNNERGRQEMPVWPLWGNETGTMIGYHSVPVIVDAYLKGFKGFDAEAAYQAMKATAMNNRNGQGEYQQYGYVLSSGTGQKQSVSRTLEFAFDDWCLAKMAEKLGHKEDAALFYKRSANYRNLFDQTTGFMRGRKEDGSWRRPFNPKQHIWADYTEANAWQYNWTAMQDSPGLVKIMGGDQAFINKMDTMFTEKDDVLTNIPDITGLIGQYAHGNEPVHHVAYLYNYAGAPYKTQFRVRDIITKFYTDTEAGAPGNNDCGQMSAWYVFSAMGFYPTNPTGGTYDLGSPVLNRATLKLDKSLGGKTFTMISVNNSPKNVYVQSVSLNNRPLNRSYITHNEILAGGTLRFVMGPNPNANWGKALASRPPSGMPADFQYGPLPTPSSNKVVQLNLPIRIVSGDDDVAGFISDPNMMEGSSNSANIRVDTNVPGAAPADVYKYERYGKDFSYKFPVPKNGLYNVRLHFAEIFDDAPNMRVENVSINGKVVLPNFDIFTAAGGVNKAVVKDFNGIAPDADGNIVIRIQATPNSPDQNAKISALEITKQ